jgi:hypothetical protein
MNKIRFISLLFAAAVIILFSFTLFAGGTIKGKITPADAAFQACAVAGKDSFKTNILGGDFEIKGIKPGTYKLIILATAPFKTITKEKIVVIDRQITDVGEIALDK